MKAWGRSCAKRVLSVALWLVTSAVAQTSLPPPGTVPTPVELAPKLIPAPADPSELPRRPPPRELGKPARDIAIDVTRYEVADDAPPAVKEHLAVLTQPYVGAKRSYEELQNAAADVTRYMQSELGYYLGYAYLPEQVPQGGVVRIAILEGRLDKVELKWTEGLPVSRSVVEGYLAQLKPGSVLRVRDVERIVFLINDLRGITARFEVEAGSRPGTATLVVTPVAAGRLGGRIDVDSNGAQYLGKFRASGLLSVDSPFGRGDGLTADLLSSQTRGLEFALLGYTTPLFSDGLKIGSSLSALHYQLARKDFPQDLHGDSTAGTVYALYPNIRSRNLNLFTLLSVEHKRYTDTQAEISTPKAVSSVSLGVSGDARDALLSGGADTYDVSYAAGRVHYDDGRPGGLLDSAHYGKIDFTFSRLQNLITSRLLLYGLLSGQVALQNLDSTEQFRVGGPDGIRAYAPGDGTGDSGAYLTLELRLLPPAEWLGPHAREFVFGAFYDYGQVRKRRDTSQESPSFDNSQTLSGAGLSLTWEGAEGYAVHSSLAMPASHALAGDSDGHHVRLYVQLTKSFR